MKDPAFLFYPNDYLGGTMGMTFEEKGAYIELLMLQFNRGHMTSHMIAQTVGQLWDNIKDKFKRDADGNYYNERLEIEVNKRRAYTESRRNNIKGINQYTKKSKKNGHINGHMTSHMENEIINEIRSKDILKGGMGGNLEIVNELMHYFGFTEMRNPDKLKQSHMFINILQTDNKLELFKEQFKAYKKYKEESKEIRHAFPNFLGSIENRYLDGGWNSRNWTAEIKNRDNNSGLMSCKGIFKMDRDNNSGLMKPKGILQNIS